MVLEEMIGRRIRQLRHERNMTQEVLARAAGLTKGYLSRIENSKFSPPVSTIVNISRALGVSVDAIFSEEATTTDYTLVRRSERQEVERTNGAFRYSYEMLNLRFPNRHMDAYILTTPADAEGRGPEFAHRGEELLFVLEGQGIWFLGQHTIRLEEGDCLYFNSSIPHSGMRIGDGDFKCLAVLLSPDGSGDGAEEG